ncbi:MAG: NAD-dependent epimerase/dehydratase family protein [Gemmataceae bacterium]|nr:NAD-dependent epimerase/dehydratase family protein [Gemmataceae bacterium]
MIESNGEFWADKRVCVTGGTGFLGWHLVRQLLDLTPHVRLFGFTPKAKSLREKMRSLDCVFGDVRDPVAVRQAVHGCDIVFHTAGNIAVWGPGLATMHEINVGGTNNVIHALAPNARLVHTSSVMAIGSSTGGEALTETSSFNLQSLKVDYVHTKKKAEDLVRCAAERGLDAVIVNPGYLIGPNDYENSVMGKFCVRFWKRKMPILPPGALNFVDVRDVACGHLLAAERGQRARRYILGGENLTIRQFATKLVAARDMPMRWRCSIPIWANTLLASLGEWRGKILKREPYPAMQFARMSRHVWHFSSERAQAELGFHARSVAQSLSEAHAWFCAEGRLRAMDCTPNRLAA